METQMRVDVAPALGAAGAVEMGVDQEHRPEPRDGLAQPVVEARVLVVQVQLGGLVEDADRAEVREAQEGIAALRQTSSRSSVA